MPVFPLAGVLLLPRGRLPLNIFEPRYLAMTLDVLASPSRMIGMIQPLKPDAAEANPPLYKTGCAGRITSFAETDDGRFLITLSGVIRFTIGDELPLRNGFRRVVPRFDGFEDDLVERDCTFGDMPGVARDRLLGVVRGYFACQGMTANFDVIEATPDERLVTSLAMVCPFAPEEKQALLETKSLADRAQMIVALMEMAQHAAKGHCAGTGPSH